MNYKNIMLASIALAPSFKSSLATEFDQERFEVKIRGLVEKEYLSNVHSSQ